eukprot:10654898-Lingulodinium_polyedra.AAC.1
MPAMPILKQSVGVVQARLEEVVSNVGAKGCAKEDAKVHLVDPFLGLRKEPTMVWICRAILHQVA